MSSPSLAQAALNAVRKSVIVAAPVALAFEVFTGRIATINPVVDPRTRTARANCTTNNETQGRTSVLPFFFTERRSNRRRARRR